MGVLLNAYRNSKLRSLVPPPQGGFVPTQPGDPDFTLASTLDSQAQYPAAAAERQVFQTQQRAGNFLDAAQASGVDVNQPQFQPIQQAAERGFFDGAKTLGLNLLRLLDGPSQAINLFIQVISGGEKQVIGRQVNLGDFMDAFLGGVNDPEQFERETGLDPMSGSKTLELWGWDEASNLPEKIVRGLADFTLRTATDPLTYLTFGASAVGKKVLRATADRVSADMVPKILKATRGLETEVGVAARLGGMAAGRVETATSAIDNLHPYMRGLARQLPDLTKNFEDNVLRRMDTETLDALSSYFKKVHGVNSHNLDELTDLAHRHIEELALQNKIADDILKPLMRRDFDAIPMEARDLLPKYATGGARISFPFLGTKSLQYGITIPGTVGMGKRFVGDPLREVGRRLQRYPAFKKAFGWMASVGENLDVNRALFRGLGKPTERGGIAGWQYSIASNALDMMSNNMNKQVVYSFVNNQASVMFDAAKRAGFEDQGMIFNEVLNRMEKYIPEGADEFGSAMHELTGLDVGGLQSLTYNKAGQVVTPDSLDAAQTLSVRGVPGVSDEVEALDKIIGNMAQSLTNIMGEFYGSLQRVLPKEMRVGLIRNYVPHVVSKEGKFILDDLARNVPFSRAELEQYGTGGALLSQLINAHGQGGRIETQLGSTRYIDPRNIGKVATSIVDDGVVLFHKESLRPVLREGRIDPNALGTAYMTVSEINDEIGAVLSKLIEEGKIVPPRGWTGKILNENPLEVFSQYIDNLHEATKMWATLDSLSAAGLMIGHKMAFDMEESAHAVLKTLLENSRKVRVGGEVEQLLPELVGKTTEMRVPWLKARSQATAYGLDPDDFEGNQKLFGDLLADNSQKGRYEFINRETPTGPRIPRYEGQGQGLLDMANRDRLAAKKGRVSTHNTTLAGKTVALTSDVTGTTYGYYDEAGNLAATLRYHEALDGRPMMDWGDIPFEGNTPHNIRQAAINLMDHVSKGPMKGKLTYDNVMYWLEHQNASVAGLDAIWGYLQKVKLRFDDDALEAITKGKPAELVRFEDTLREFETTVNELLVGTSHHAHTAEAGATRVLNKDFKMIDDERYKELFDDARRLAEELELPELAQLFGSRTRKFMGLSETPNMVNPAIFALGGPAAEDVIMQRDVAVWVRQLARNHTSIYTPQGVAALKLQTNSVLRWWKAMATVARPSFHVRNLVGGTWNNMLIGVRARDYVAVRDAAIRVRNVFKREATASIDEAIEIAGLNPRMAATLKAAWENDVLSGFVTSEFRTLSSAEKAGRLAFLKAWDVDTFALTKIGANFMESIEDFLRLSAFHAWYDPTDPSTLKVAKEMVEAVHFNYGNLTPFETRMKQFVPFFVWSRRNLPLQISVYAENPRMMQRYAHMMNAIDDQFTESDEGGLPTGDKFSAYAAGTGYYVNPESPFWARVMIDPDLPVRDFLNLPMPTPPELSRFMFDLLGPQITAIADLNQEREYGDVNAAGPMQVVLKSLAAIGLFDTTTSGDVRVPYWARSIMETGIPFSRDVIDPLIGGPTDPSRQASLGIDQGDSGLESILKSVGFSIARGLGIKLATPRDAASAANDADEQLNDLIQSLRLGGEAPPAER